MTDALFTPRKAEKKRVKLKMAIQGPSGSGKTWGALSLAKNLWPDAKICVIDTENESASLYADSFEFDTIPLGPPFGTNRYIWAIDAVVKAEYDVLIIDSITPQWDGEGGILRRKEDMERKNPGANGYALWARFTPEHEAFKQVILQSPLHVICTMRSKQEYALQTNDKGKQVPVKLGLAPIQRDQMDYEFTLVFDLGLTHIGSVSKDRTGLFNETTVDLADPKTAEAIKGWLSKGTEEPAKPFVVPTVPEQVAPGPNEGKSKAQIEAEDKWNKLDPPNKLMAEFEQASHQAMEAVKGHGRTAVPTQTDVLKEQLKASLSAEELKAQRFEFIAPNMLICTIRSYKAPKEGGKFATITFNGYHKTCNFASCWDKKLFPVLESSVGKEVQLALKEADKNGQHYINVEDVLKVEGVEYAYGAPLGVKSEKWIEEKA